MSIITTVGSIGGNVTLTAGDSYTQIGSDVLAPSGDILIGANTVNILEGRETSNHRTEQRFKQSGLSLSLSNPMMDSAQGIKGQIDAAGNTDSPRMQALAAANTALAVKDIQQQITNGNATDFSLNISLGSSQRRSNSEASSNTARGSTITAGGNLAIHALGLREGKGEGEGSITVQGSQLDAGNTLQLNAAEDIHLLASVDGVSQHDSHNSSSGSIGLGIGTNGLALNLDASRAKGHGNGDSTFYNNTQVSAGNQVILTSGGDTALKGAVVSAPNIATNIGGDLTIESLQDTSVHNERHASSGVGASIPLTGGTPSLNLDLSRTKVDSDFQSVNQQSGLRAGDGGFQVNVGGRTHLNGGVITSTQTAIDDDRNIFTTAGQTASEALESGALTLSDIGNRASYDAESTSVGLSSGGKDSGESSTGLSGIGTGRDDGEASSTTVAAISGLAGNQDARTGDAESGIAPIFDADNVRKDVQAQATITQEFGSRASQWVGDIAQAKVEEAQLKRRQAQQAHAAGDTERANQLNAQADQLQSDWGENGTKRLAAHTAIGALTGGTQGATGAAVGTLSAPAVASALKNAGLDDTRTDGLTALASTAAGAATGGSQGGAAAFNEVANNYLAHEQLATARTELVACEGDNTCMADVVERYQALSQEQNEAANAACATDLAACQEHSLAAANGEYARYVDDSLWDLPNEALPYMQALFDENIGVQNAYGEATIARLLSEGGISPEMAAVLAAANTALAVKDIQQQITNGNATDFSLNISLGSSQRRSNSEASSNTARGSTITAGGNLAIHALGLREGQGTITVQGSQLDAGNQLQLNATQDINLLASVDGVSQHDSHSSSSGSIGLGIGTNGIALNLDASRAKGHGNGDSTFFNNTQLSAGNQVILTSGGDTALKGAVVSAPQITTNIGGDLTIESLQDTSVHNERHASSGFGASIPLAGGAPSLNLDLSRTKINSDFQSVNQQSGLRAGDGGFQVNVGGNTTLNGGAITSTQTAIDDDRNIFTTAGQTASEALESGALTLSDIGNSASYDAESISVGLSSGENSSGESSTGLSGIGTGRDDGEASSATESAISGLAGNQDARTGDAESGLAPIFDADNARKDVQAQAAITQEFGSRASQAWGDYANDKWLDAMERGDAEDSACWAANGSCRSAGHLLIGGATGGVDGALGAGVSTQLAPQVLEALQDSGLPQTAQDNLAILMATAAGSAVGGAEGGAAGYNEAANNATQAVALCRVTPACVSALSSVLGGSAATAMLDDEVALTGNEETDLLAALALQRAAEAALFVSELTGGNSTEYPAETEQLPISTESPAQPIDRPGRYDTPIVEQGGWATELPVTGPAYNDQTSEGGYQILDPETQQLIGGAVYSEGDKGVVEGETGLYGDLSPRSVRDGLTPDHIPSFAAVKENLRQNGVDVDSLSDADLRALRNNTNCVVVSTCDHQAFSRTYGGRNTQSQIQADGVDLMRAADADLNTWEAVWRESGWSEAEIIRTRQEVHTLNRQLFEELGIPYGSD